MVHNVVLAVEKNNFPEKFCTKIPPSFKNGVIVAFLNLMNHKSFHESLLVRGMIGLVMVSLVAHWMRIFFRSKVRVG